MKKYPYIYSLSTIGLIHHYNNDYLFNRVRTDFTGDSGTGKSIIADLLQLIFVGSSVFVAATQAIDEKRETKGLVLYDKKRGHGGKGYTFLNIAVDEGQYLVIGMYMEQSTNFAKPFIVHKGYNIEKPTYLEAPILHEEFLELQTILPIEGLKEHLKKKKYNCEPLQTTFYHKFLFTQKILPFDLADNPDKLKTYALIIRSFSRGKGFKFDSQNLQNFLFGTNKEKELHTNYNNEIEKIESALNDSLEYQVQINLLKDKKEALQNLISLEKIKIDFHKDYLNTQYWFYKTKKISLNKSKSDVFSDLLEVMAETVLLSQMDNEQQIEEVIKDIADAKEVQKYNGSDNELELKEKLAKREYFEARNAIEQIEAINNLLIRFNHSLKKIKEYYYLQAQNTEDQKELEKFNEQLRKKEILNEPELVNWLNDYPNALSQYNIRIKELEIEIEKKKALLKFSDIENRESIANWAINREKAFSLAEESVLIKLKELIVAQHKDTELKYLPFPDELFDNINQNFHDSNGFWLNLNGILEYVPYVTKQFLSSAEPNIKREYFSKEYANAKEFIGKAEKELLEKESFFNKLNSISGLQENIDLYKRKTEIENFKILDSLDVQIDEFDKILNHYDKKEQILNKFSETEKTWEYANSKFKSFQNKVQKFSKEKEIQVHIDELEEKKKLLFEGKNSIGRKISLLSYVLNGNNEDINQVLTVLNILVQRSSLAKVLKDKTELEAKLQFKRESIKKQLKDTDGRLQALAQEFVEHNFQIGDNKKSNIESTVLEAKESEFNTAETNYKNTFKLVVDNYITHDKYKFENEDDWRKLARSVLPEIFKSKEITNDQFSTEVDQRLQKIIDQNKIIGDRKTQTLIDIFTKVEDSFSKFSNEIDRLKTFFDGNDKRITGGHKVVLELEPSKEYPIGWINEFKKQIRQESTYKVGGLFKLINEGIDFKENILKSFKQCGGKKINPKITDLLNPKMYFTLSFSLQKDKVKNSGSTGQVYSAIALLCIARISLIEQDDGNKQERGIRFMPVDEAEGIGSNYEMLSNIAKNEDYQIISMSINPVGEFEEGSHYIYMLNEPEDEEVPINGIPFAQFIEERITENILEYNIEPHDE